MSCLECSRTQPAEHWFTLDRENNCLLSEKQHVENPLVMRILQKFAGRHFCYLSSCGWNLEHIGPVSVGKSGVFFQLISDECNNSMKANVCRGVGVCFSFSSVLSSCCFDQMSDGFCCVKDHWGKETNTNSVQTAIKAIGEMPVVQRVLVVLPDAWMPNLVANNVTWLKHKLAAHASLTFRGTACVKQEVWLFTDMGSTVVHGFVLLLQNTF